MTIKPQHILLGAAAIAAVIYLSKKDKTPQNATKLPTGFTTTDGKEVTAVSDNQGIYVTMSGLY
jgi:hypothetical protein